MLLLVAMVACLAGVSNAAKDKLPEYFPPACARNDPKLPQCIKVTVQQLLPHLLKGDRNLDLDILDPASVNDVHVDFKQEPVVMSATIPTSKTYGSAGIQVKNARVKRIDNDNLDMEIDVHIPKLLVEGNFKLNGHIGNFITNGKGFFNISLTAIKSTWKISGSAVEIAKERYMKIRSFYLDYSMDNMKVYADNLVDRAPQITPLVLQLINTFWRAIFRAGDPYTREPFSRIMSETANKVFMNIPYDQLFPVA